MKTDEILKLVEWYASRRGDHFRLATLETSHDLCVALGAIKDAVDTTLSQAEANRVDAERYRWLRNFASPRQKPAPEDMPLSYYPVLLRCDTAVYSPATWGADVDRLVDAARLTNAVKTKG